MGIITSLLQAVDLAFSMAWESWWALVLGFTVTGAVEVFVSEEEMTEYLGGDGWREVTYGTLFGIASSSCSYSAIATAKTLFKKGASPVAAIAGFMFAATDLVVELGLVMWILLGWKFVVADFLGGVLSVVMLAVVLRRVPDEWWDVAYENVLELNQVECPACGMAAPPHEDETVPAEHDGETLHFCCGGCLNAWEAMNDADADVIEDENPGLLSERGWRQAATNAMREWDMLWDDIAIGFAIAGAVAAFVPRTWWLQLFDADSSGFLWVVYGAVVGVFIGVVTFICSVGNVPFALVLWSNGLPFGAVLSFVYSDLVIPPIVNAYRKYYGARIAGVLFLSMAAIAVVAGVVVHYVFAFSGLIPPQGTAGGTAPDEYTVVLNLAFTALFGAQVVVAYGRETVGDWVLDAIGRAGELYWRLERRFGTATENYRRFKRAMEVLATVLGTAADAAGDVAESTARNLEETAEEVEERSAALEEANDTESPAADAAGGDDSEAVHDGPSGDPRRDARERDGQDTTEAVDRDGDEAADASEPGDGNDAETDAGDDGKTDAADDGER